MRSLIFDTSSIITLAMNNLLDVLKELKSKFDGEFYISEAVKKELIDYPLTTRRFKLEALITQELLTSKIINLNPDRKAKEKAIYLLDLVNRIYKTDGGYIKILHAGEVESLALAIILNSDAYVVDERTIRVLIENPDSLLRLLEEKLHTKVSLNKENLDKLREEVKDLKIIRSTELSVIAYEKGLLDKYIKRNNSIEKELKRTLLDGLLWGLRLKGCSISTDEIENILKLEKV